MVRVLTEPLAKALRRESKVATAEEKADEPSEASHFYMTLLTFNTNYKQGRLNRGWATHTSVR